MIYVNGEASMRTRDMIFELKEQRGLGLLEIRKAIGCDMETWREFKNNRLTDEDCFNWGVYDEYCKLHKMCRDFCVAARGY